MTSRGEAESKFLSIPVARLPAPVADESDMLDFAAAPVKPTSRLSCQIALTPELDGLVVHLPATQY